MEITIPFNVPFQSPKELEYLATVLRNGTTAGKGEFTEKVEAEFATFLGIPSLFTNSCTAALEMSALLLNIDPGDEVILPSYTFPSTANAFLLRGAKLVFADSSIDHPNLDLNHVADLISPKTKAILPMYYGGVAVDFRALKSIAGNICIIEEAAQAYGAYYFQDGIKYPLGSIGDMSVFSFHATKNFSAGEGGAFVTKHFNLYQKAEIIQEKGTNRAAFKRGELNKYEWIAPGSSYVQSELNAAYLLAQLEAKQYIIDERRKHWDFYFSALQTLQNLDIQLPVVPTFAEHNAHLFYLVLPDVKMLEKFQNYLFSKGITASTHYRCLHSSYYFSNTYSGRKLENADRFENCLLRLPLYPTVPAEKVVHAINQFFK